MSRLKHAEQQIHRALEKHKSDLEMRYLGEAVSWLSFNIFAAFFQLHKHDWIASWHLSVVHLILFTGLIPQNIVCLLDYKVVCFWKCTHTICSIYMFASREPSQVAVDESRLQIRRKDTKQPWEKFSSCWKGIFQSGLMVGGLRVLFLMLGRDSANSEPTVESDEVECQHG